MAFDRQDHFAICALMFEPPWLEGYGGLLLHGLMRTVLIAVSSYFLGLVLGLGLALWHGHARPLVKLCIGFYTGFLRALPELILIMLLYYACSDVITRASALIGFAGFSLDGVSAAIIVLGMAASAYATEIFKAGIAAVPVGALEAAASLGMGWHIRFGRISLPLMLPIVLPGFSNLWLMVVKGTSLVSVVGVMEMALAAEQGAGATKSYFAFYLSAAGVYFCIAFFSTRFFGWLEKRLQRAELNQ